MLETEVISLIIYLIAINMHLIGNYMKRKGITREIAVWTWNAWGYPQIKVLEEADMWAWMSPRMAWGYPYVDSINLLETSKYYYLFADLFATKLRGSKHKLK